MEKPVRRVYTILESLLKVDLILRKHLRTVRDRMGEEKNFDVPTTKIAISSVAASGNQKTTLWLLLITLTVQGT